MPSAFQRSGSTMPGGGQFTNTHWSVVLQAAQTGTPQAAAALEKLCRTYWYPLYVWIRRRGFDAHTAQDLTQEFFVQLLERKSFDSVGPEKGKFRSFLLAALNHFLANEWDRMRAQKRGGHYSFISLDQEDAEGHYLKESVPDLAADKAFERRWAMTVLELALARLREESEGAGKGQIFEALKPFLTTEPGPGDYAAAAERLGWAQSTAGVAVHRLRQRFRDLVREEVAQTVASPAEINEEMGQLFAALI